MTRKLVTSASPFEREVGFSRAVRVGNIIEVAGTAPIGANAPGDMYAQTKRCLEIIAAALVDAGGELRHVTRTRIMLTDMTRWREAARAHGEVFADIRPGCTFVEVSAFIDPEWLVEIEAAPSSNSAKSNGPGFWPGPRLVLVVRRLAEADRHR